jgi:hypothetical protein
MEERRPAGPEVARSIIPWRRHILRGSHTSGIRSDVERFASEGRFSFPWSTARFRRNGPQNRCNPNGQGSAENATVGRGLCNVS